jgi:hypothetical protein
MVGALETPTEGVNSEEVLRMYRNTFYRSLINQDYDELTDLYADEYMLVRLYGSVLSKEAGFHVSEPWEHFVASRVTQGEFWTTSTESTE